MTDHAVEPTDFQQGEAQTLQRVLDDFDAEGYSTQFGSRAGGVIRCFTCQREMPAARADVEELRRLEGASDPDDMLAVLRVTCHHCTARGTLVLAYGPEASGEDSEVLARLPDVN